MRRALVRTALALIVVGTLAVPARAADEPLPTAAEHTRRGRSLARSLDEALAAGSRDDVDQRSIVLVLDASPELKSVGFAAALRDAVKRAGAALDATRLTVLEAREDGRPVTGDAGEHDPVLDTIDGLLATPRSQFADVYDATRRATRLLARDRGARDIVLVTLENGDVESDVEAVAKAAARADVRVSVVTWQSFLSDTYWTVRASQAPRGMTPRGGEAAFVELPWGFLFQNAVANEHTGSGFAEYGLTRLAAATGGTVFLFDDGKAGEHSCYVPATTCVLCTSDHLPEGTAYQSGMLDGLAPLAASRRDAFRAAADDPCFQATLVAWDAATDAGIVRSAPSVKRSGSSLKESGMATSSRMAELGQTLGFDREARNAEELAEECAQIATRLREDIDAAESEDTSPRLRATAETTYALLRITYVNLRGFAAWCRDVGPVLIARDTSELPYPELPVLTATFRPTGIGFTGVSLCHGVRPLLDHHWPGGAELRADMEALDDVLVRLLAKYAHSPYAMAIRRSTLARFYLAGRGKYVPPPPRKRPGSESDDPTTGGPDRPDRGGGGSSGSGGASTGGD